MARHAEVGPGMVGFGRAILGLVTMLISIRVRAEGDAPKLRNALKHASGAFARNGDVDAAQRFKEYADEVLLQYHEQ